MKVLKDYYTIVIVHSMVNIIQIGMIIGLDTVIQIDMIIRLDIVHSF